MTKTSMQTPSNSIPIGSFTLKQEKSTTRVLEIQHMRALDLAAEFVQEGSWPSNLYGS